MSTRPPGGSPPPEEVAIDGRTTELIPVAQAICARYRAEFPDEQERHGDAGQAWCVHDNRWLLHWAATDVGMEGHFTTQVLWLARILRARDFPLERLARNLEIGSEVVVDGRAFGRDSAAVGACLRGGAGTVQELATGSARAPQDG